MRHLFATLLVAGLSLMAFAGTSFGQDETVCIQCHAGQGSEELSAPVALWRQSIHAANGISCHDCHGGDPTDFAMAMSPERGFIGVPDHADIPEFCGRCHVGVQEDYAESAHGLAVEAGGAQCVTCHNAHDVKKAEISLINEQDCSRCHEYGRAGEIKSAILETEQLIDGIESDLEEMHSRGIATSQLSGELFDIRNRYRRLFHSVDVDKVRSETAGFQEELKEIRAQISGIESSLDRRKLWGGAVVGLLVVAGIVSTLIRKTYHEEE